MHVTHMIRTAGLTGIEQHVLALLRALQGRGVEADLVILDGPGETAESVLDAARATGIPARRERLGRMLDPGLFARLRDDLRVRRPSLVHTHLLDADLYGTLAARHAGVRAIVSTRYNEAPGHTPRPAGWLRRRKWARPDRIIAVSGYAREEALARGIPPGRLAVIPYGIDPGGLRVGGGARAVLSAELGIPADARLIGIVAALTGCGGVQQGVEAMWHVSALRPDVHLLLVGDGPAREALAQQVRGFRLGNRVHFLGWRDDIPAVIAALDVLLMPCSGRDQSAVLLEAMALGTAVLAGAGGGVDEIVTDGETGLLVPPGDVDHLTSSLSLLLDEPDLRHNLAEAARSRVAERFPFERMVAGTLDLYRDLLAP